MCIAEIVAAPCGNPESAMPRTSDSGERNRAIGAHFPKAADIAAAAGLAARLAVRFKPCMPADFKPGATGTARALVTFPVREQSFRCWDHGLARRFRSSDEVSRPRLGFDANLNRDVTLR